MARRAVSSGHLLLPFCGKNNLYFRKKILSCCFKLAFYENYNTDLAVIQGECRKSYPRVSTICSIKILIVMKKIFTFLKASTLLLSLSLSFGAKAQGELGCVMQLNNSIKPLEYLTSGTRVMDIEMDCASKTGIPLGFTYRHGACGSTVGYNSCQVSSKGFIKFGAAVSGCVGTPGANSYPGLWAFYGPLMDGTGGTASYETVLLPSGTKVFTMEWKDWKWKADALSTGYYGITFQIKIYEGSNVVEYCYKNETSTATSPGGSRFMVGIGQTAATAALSLPPCGGNPGYKYFIMNLPITTPSINRLGTFGPGQSVVPNDNQVLQFYQACCAKPSAGYISQPDSVCACSPFVAKLSGATPSPFPLYGVTYLWQASASATGPWTDIGLPSSTATSQYFSGLCGSLDTFIRVIVTCANAGLSDTTPVKRISLITLPYNCYCYSSATIDDNLNTVNIGNVKLITKGNDTLINNTKDGGTPGYVNKTFFRTYTLNTGLKPVQEVNRDTSYKFSVMGITKDTFAFSSSGVALYIDYNADGIYTPSTELAAFQVISGTASSFITNFTVPSTALLDTIIGMRVVMKRGATISSDVPPCGGYTQGETEDYLLKVVNPKCPGPISAGIAYITDTSICDGYSTTVWDTAHGKNLSQFHWEWEYSLDNIIWANVPASKFKDTIQPVVRQSTYYRLRTVCEVSNDTIYSNKVYIKLKQPYKCYCYSLANGNSSGVDSSDITAVKLHTFDLNTGGPHVRNPESIHMRTDHTDLAPIELYAETKYPIAVYHTLRTVNHADAKISVFMDFNHNLKYDGASELIWSKITSSTDFYPHDTIFIPAAVIPNVETGMRVVLNNDIGNNNPNDQGCDAFTSGEIEDYLLIFRRRTTGIGEVTNMDNLQIYPNPNNGQFTISFNASKTITEASVVITNITGQQVYQENYSNISNSFVKNINLADQASGVYFITVTADGQKTVNKLIVR